MSDEDLLKIILEKAFYVWEGQDVVRCGIVGDESVGDVLGRDVEKAMFERMREPVDG